MAAATRAGGDLRSQAMARIADQARAETASPARPRKRSSSGTRATNADRVASAVRAGQSAPPPTGQTAAAAATLPLPAAAAAAPSPAPSSSATAAAAPAAPSSSSSPAAARSFGVEGAGAFLALFCYPMLVNLLSGGPAQMWGWIRAKWINQPYGAVSSAGPTATAGQQTVFLPAAATAPNGTVTRTGLKAT